jgi:hypothetical protein
LVRELHLISPSGSDRGASGDRGTGMSNLRLLALCFLLPGMAGLILSSMVSVSYLQNLPKVPDPFMMRMNPRQIHDVTVYQTVEEDRRLDTLEYSSMTVFGIGLGLSLVYLRKWGIARAIEGEEGDFGYDEG